MFFFSSLDLAKDNEDKFINCDKFIKALKETKDGEPSTSVTTQFRIELEKLVEGLIEIIDPKNKSKYSETARAEAAILIRELRAEEAIPMLCSSLDDQPFKSVVFGAEGIWTLCDSFSGALIKIGRPAVPHLIKNLKESKNKEVLKKSTRLLLWILGDKNSVLKIIEKLTKENPELEQRLKEAKTIVEKWGEKKPSPKDKDTKPNEDK